MYICIYKYTHARAHTYTLWTITQPLKQNERFPLAKAWMDLKGIMLNEMSDRKEKDKYHIISSMESKI